MKKYIGLDIGGTKCAMTLGIVDEKISIERKEKFATDGTPKTILEKFSSFIEDCLREEEIAGIGISCGGPLDSKKGVIMSPPSLPSWDNIKIVEYFEKKFGIPTFLQNDANACAVAEWKFGAGKGCDNVVFLTFGTGLGAGIIINGKLYSGTNDNAGEIGHVRLTRNGPIGYRKAGSVEGYCSGSGIQRLASIMAEKEEKKGKYPIVAQKHGKDNLTAKILAEYASKGDAFCKNVYKKSGLMLGRTLSILIDVLNPQRIIIGGVYMRSEELLLPYAQKVIEKEALSSAARICEILPAALSENIGDVAALSIAKGDF